MTFDLVHIADLPERDLETFVNEIALPVGPGRLATALSLHAKSHDILMRVRSIPLQYTPTYVEPLTALRWIENGGRTTP
jgi:hypothetical protein